MDDTVINTSTIENESQDSKRTSKQYKDTLFRALFQDKKRFIELYNAIAHENYPENINIEPCPINPIMAMYNDLAFLIGSKLIIMCEHKSTINMNMPIRLLFYISDVLRNYIINKDLLYRRALVQIPTPEFYFLYNGNQEYKDHKMILSDAFLMKNNVFTLELTVKIINIHFTGGDAALEHSASLNGYSFLIAEVENNVSKGLSRDESIKKAIYTCIKKRILSDYLIANFNDVVNMLTIEYDKEAELRVQQQEAREEGRLIGRLQGIHKINREGMREVKRDILNQLQKNWLTTIEEISELTEIPITELQELID